MLILASVVLAVALVPVTGGELRRLGRLGWRSPWLVLGAPAIQLVVLQVPAVPHAAAAPARVATFVMADAFVWLNRRVSGLTLLALGAGLNGVAIVLNGGTLPSSAEARAVAGLDATEGFANSAVVAEPVLGFLGDVFAVPAWFPLANVFSIGDVLIVLGAVWVLIAATRVPTTVPRHARRPAAPLAAAR